MATRSSEDDLAHKNEHEEPQSTNGTPPAAINKSFYSHHGQSFLSAPFNLSHSAPPSVCLQYPLQAYTDDPDFFSHHGSTISGARRESRARRSQAQSHVSFAASEQAVRDRQAMSIQHGGSTYTSEEDPSIRGSLNRSNGGDEGPSAAQILWQVIRRNLTAAGTAVRANPHLTMFGAVLTAACSVSVTLSAISYLSLDSSSSSSAASSASFMREPAWPGGPTISELFDTPDPNALVATTASPIGSESTSNRALDLRVAFGSKYLADGTHNSFWQDVIAPLEPHAWIWSGNAAFFDSSALNCSNTDNAGHTHCACMSSSTSPSPLCDGASVENAALRISSLAESGYGAYLDYACNGYFTAADVFPPGTYPDICPRPVLGIYGTHDSFGRLEDASFSQKNEIKQAYLDIVGERADSERRSSNRGAHARQRLFEDSSGRAVDVYLLDEHFHRSAVPCATLSSTCSLPEHTHTRICQQYASDPQSTPCCDADDLFAYGWCQTADARSHAAYTTLCKPWDTTFGTQRYQMSSSSPNPTLADPTNHLKHATAAGAAISESFCDVLGYRQRNWLRKSLLSSNALLNIVVAPGGVLGNPAASGSGGCTGSEWDCFRPAQVNLLHTFANATGCTLIISGDQPYADFKVARPSDALPYASAYAATQLAKSVYQVSTSGLSALTASGVDKSCGAQCCGNELDSSILRIGGSCAVYGDPSFGLLDLDWNAREARIRIIRTDGQGTANVDDWQHPASLDFTIDMQLCMDA